MCSRHEIKGFLLVGFNNLHETMIISADYCNFKTAIELCFTKEKGYKSLSKFHRFSPIQLRTIPYILFYTFCFITLHSVLLTNLMGSSVSIPSNKDRNHLETRLPSNWIICGGLRKKDKKKLCKHWQSLRANRRKVLIKTAFNVIFRTKPELLCEFDIKCAETCTEGKRELLAERHAQNVSDFLDRIFDFLKKKDCEGAHDMVETVGKAHTKFGTRFDAEYWLVYKRALLEQICMGSNPAKKMLWNRFLTLMIREMRKAL